MKVWHVGLVFFLMVSAVQAESVESIEAKQAKEVAKALVGPTDFRALFAQAIDSKDGRIGAQLKGPLAERMKAELKTDANIFVGIAVVKALPQPGCARLAVQFIAPNAKLPTANGGVSPLKGVGFELNMCRDGNPPILIDGKAQTPPNPSSANNSKIIQSTMK